MGTTVLHPEQPYGWQTCRSPNKPSDRATQENPTCLLQPKLTLLLSAGTQTPPTAECSAGGTAVSGPITSNTRAQRSTLAPDTARAPVASPRFLRVRAFTL